MMKTKLFKFLNVMLLSIFSIFAFAEAPSVGNIEDVLTELYTKQPVLRVQLNPQIFYEEAEKVVGVSNAKKLDPLLNTTNRSDFEQFMRVRAKVIRRLIRHNIPPKESLPRIIVSGQSVSGMYTAALAAQAGFEVTVYEKRDGYRREIQWSSRQSIPDSLAAIDMTLAEEFIRFVARPLEKGYGVVHPDGSFTIREDSIGTFSSPDPRKIPQIGADMLSNFPVGTVETKVMEAFLETYTKNHPNIMRFHGHIKLGGINRESGLHDVTEYKYVEQFSDSGKPKYVEVQIDRPDDRPTLVIIAEGVGGTTRRDVGISATRISPDRLQMAGVVWLEQAGEITTLYGQDESQGYVAGSMSTRDSKKRWLVTDVPHSVQTRLVATSSAEAKEALLETTFREIAEKNLRLPPGSLFERDDKGNYKIKISGAIENQPIATFELQQSISPRAISGRNVFLLGDAVGNGHWAVGGGIHIAMVSHGERIKKLLGHLTQGDYMKKLRLAGQEYNQGVISDSLAWAQKGLHFFYLDSPKEMAEAVFLEAMEGYFKGTIRNPQIYIDKKMGGTGTQIKEISSPPGTTEGLKPSLTCRKVVSDR
ncbi:MAG: hypothetical protein IPL83_18205 [Bdellovibrionales bacterium]|nr:hypothetical protein [Bdellovibrionales bacterium]